MMSLFGSMFVEGNTKRIISTIQYLAGQLKDGMLPDNFNPGTAKKYSVDCSLFMIYFLLYLYNTTRDKKLLETFIYEKCQEILENIKEGEGSNIYRDKDGLLFAGTRSENLTGFPPPSDSGQSSRYGKMLEVNALYYNALKTLEYFSLELAKKRDVKKYATMAAVTRKSMLSKFWDESKVQFSDVVRENYRDNSFRINQLFLIALPFSILDETLGLNVLNQIEKELLTPFGLRSLSYHDKNYIGKLDRIIGPDDPEYFQGSVWPWSIRMYAASVIKYRGEQQQVIDYLKKILDNFSRIFYYESIGSLPEIFEGDPPHRRNGAFSSSLTMNEFLLAYHYLQNNDH